MPTVTDGHKNTALLFAMIGSSRKTFFSLFRRVIPCFPESNGLVRRWALFLSLAARPTFSHNLPG